MVSHICLLVELGPICNFIAASLCLRSCEDHSLIKSYNGGLWKKNNYRSGPLTIFALSVHYLLIVSINIAKFLKHLSGILLKYCFLKIHHLNGVLVTCILKN